MPKKLSKNSAGKNCPSSKLFNGQREACTKNRGHDPPHQDIFNRTWK
jgi:hypothetical protein